MYKKIIVLLIILMLISCSTNNGKENKVESIDGNLNVESENKKGISKKEIKKTLEKGIKSKLSRKSKIEVNADYISIKDKKGKEQLKMDKKNIFVGFPFNGYVFHMYKDGISIHTSRLNDEKYLDSFLSMGKYILSITDGSLSNELVFINPNITRTKNGFKGVINFGKSLTVGDSFSVGEKTKIRDYLEFTDDSLIILNFEIKNNGVFENGKKIGDIESLKFSDDIYITKDEISFAPDIYIKRNEIKHKEKVINTTEIRYTKDSFIDKTGKIMWKGKGN